jgi:hypothetical protein
MMNMIELQDKLKNFSQEQLVGMMQQPSGEAPQFMVLGEITRRQKMQQEATKAPTQSVAQEAVAAAGVPQGGIADMARTLAPQTNVAQNTGAMSAPPQGMPSAPQGIAKMASGGVIRLVGGSKIDRLELNPKVIAGAARNNMTPKEYVAGLSPSVKKALLSDIRQSAEGIDTLEADSVPGQQFARALQIQGYGDAVKSFMLEAGKDGLRQADAVFAKAMSEGSSLAAATAAAASAVSSFVGAPELGAYLDNVSAELLAKSDDFVSTRTGERMPFGYEAPAFFYETPEQRAEKEAQARQAEAARIAGKATEDVTSVRGPNGELPESIIQSRRMAAPEYPIAPEASPYQGQGRGGDPFIDQQEMFIPSQDTAHQGLDSITTPEGPFYPRFTPSVEGRETGLGAYKGNDRPLYAYPNTEMRPEGPARTEDVMTEGKRGELEGLRRRRDEAMQVPEGDPYVPPNPAPYAPYIGDAPVNDPRISRAYKADEALTPGEIISGSMEEAYGPSFGNIGKGIKDWWNSEQGPSFGNPPLDMDAAQLAPTPEQMNPEKTTKEKNDKLAAEAAALLGGATTGATGSGSGGSSNYETKLLEMLSRQEANAKSDKWMALAQAGMSLMQGGTGSFGGDLGRAGQTGLAALQGSRDSNDKSQLGILTAIENSKLGRARIAASSAKSGQIGAGQVNAIRLQISDLQDQKDNATDTLAIAQIDEQIRQRMALLNEMNRQMASQFGVSAPAGAASGMFTTSAAKAAASP